MIRAMPERKHFFFIEVFLKKVKCVLYVGEVCVCMGDKPFASAVSGKAQPVMEGIQEEYRNRSHKYG